MSKTKKNKKNKSALTNRKGHINKYLKALGNTILYDTEVALRKE